MLRLEYTLIGFIFVMMGVTEILEAIIEPVSNWGIFGGVISLSIGAPMVWRGLFGDVKSYFQGRIDNDQPVITASFSRRK
jgi:hypothetical protein